MLLATISATAQAQGLAPDVLFEKVSPSVWVVQTSDAQGRPVGRGSAVVTAPGRLVTNCHVLAKSNSFVVKRDNVSYGATLEFPDPERDLCQIKVANFTAPPVELADIGKLRVGAKVYAIGNPRGLEVTLSDGLISGLRKTDKDELEMVQTTAPISPGSSGGGLFDAEGRLVGITTALLRDSQNLNFAVPANWIVELAARGQANLDKRTAPVTAASPAPVAPAAPASAPNPSTQPPAARASPGPATGVGGGVLPSGPAIDPTAPLRVGDRLEYTVTDRFTNVRKSVVLRVDRISGDQVVFNQGGMIENLQGQLVSMGSPALGDMDNAMPTGGWGKADLKPGQSWQLRYKGNEPVGGKRDYNLKAVVAGESEMRVGAGAFKVVQIRYSGFVGVGSDGGTVLVPVAGPFKATVWYAPELGRVVRFDSEAQIRSARLLTRESVELTSIGRAN